MIVVVLLYHMIVRAPAPGQPASTPLYPVEAE